MEIGFVNDLSTVLSLQKGFSAKVVEETSARHGYTKVLSVAADHFGVCKPTDRVSTSYQFLTQFISEAVKTQQNSSLTRVTPVGASQMDQSVETDALS